MVRFLCKLSPYPFYTHIKQIFEQHQKSLKPSKVHLLECVILIILIFRLVALQLAINHHLTPHLPWDPTAQYLSQHRQIYAGYVLLCIALMALYVLLTNWLLFFKIPENASSSALSWQAIAHDLIVRNVDQSQQCTTQNPQNDRSNGVLSQTIKENQLIAKPVFTSSPLGRFTSFIGFLTDTLSLKRLDLDKLSRSGYQLSIFSFLSVTHRKKVLQFHLFAGVVARLFQCVTVFPIAFGISLQLLLGVPAANPKGMSFSGWLLLLNDILLIWTLGWFLFRNVVLFVYLGNISSLAYRWHLGAAHRMLDYLSRKNRPSFAQGLNPWERLLLRNLLTEHAYICALVDVTNRQLTSQATFTVLLCNCPPNIYLIYRAVYLSIPISEFTVMLLFTAVQLLCLACAFVPQAQANGALYRKGKYLPAIQLYVLRGGNNRLLKIKYEILQSTLTESRVKSGATIGSLCLITFESLYKVVTFYAVYMLAFFVLLPK